MEGPLLTDLYQFSMLDAYWAQDMTETAVFEFFVRRLPARRGFLMAAGLEQVIDYLETLCFGAEEIGQLRRCGRFGDDFLDRLAAFRFTGDVDALPEGTIFFADEPVIRVTAPLPQAQLVESRLVNLLHFQTLVASKAARMVLAAPGKRLVDFGMRRAHGAEAALLAARACYLAGFDGTATLAAGIRFDIPVFGTMAHSFIQAHDSEAEAFEHFARARPQGVTLLIDTYDTERAAELVTRVAPRLKADGIAIQAVRLDSGDLGGHARKVRAILDAAGLHEISIFASGGLDEDQLAAFTRDQVPIDGYGIGTCLTTSYDAPALDCAYKLQEYGGVPRRKQSEGKATWPGRKQVWRRLRDGRMAGDLLAQHGAPHRGYPLLRPVMRDGRRIGGPPSLDTAREHASAELRSLPVSLKALLPTSYPVEVDMSLKLLAAECDQRIAEGTCTLWV
ncbi:Nicotinate phosphoribosyltransferase pncB2 [Nitrospirillum viridazoti Y2]|uniref:Nicotinate phosphoribosyltransferase n=1 Tax=Nitrospirillum amazonense TaxID=28077 RepID=A0A560HQB6_9PROT|nr:nicotinate phosphoribosyltransferase [Nitrospirillum amazonense]EGY00653.1 Nicotinate phosphoribosyltransferase pncB2 [Nitrospirillum amazonense Y2]TWB47689.1 nicotinate phosphoribosyltransferase [Nitrospirillum amazonense]